MYGIYPYLSIFDNSNNAIFFKICYSLLDLKGSLKIMSKTVIDELYRENLLVISVFLMMILTKEKCVVAFLRMRPTT